LTVLLQRSGGSCGPELCSIIHFGVKDLGRIRDKLIIIFTFSDCEGTILPIIRNFWSAVRGPSLLAAGKKPDG